jgi:hypothetical protein
MADDDNEIIIERIIEWFRARYEDPVHSQPWDEGEYVWLVEPHDTREVLDEFFPYTPQALLETAIERLEEGDEDPRDGSGSPGCSMWVRSEDLNEENFGR